MNTEANPLNNADDPFTNQWIGKAELGPDEFDDLHLPENYQCLRIKSPIIPNQLSISFSENNYTNDNLSPTNFKINKCRPSLRHTPTIKSVKSKDLHLKSEILISAVDQKKMVSKFFKLMVLFYLVKKFIKKMRNLIFSDSFQQMGKTHFKIMNDLVFFKKGLEINKNKYENIGTRIIRKIMDFAENSFFKCFFRMVKNLICKLCKFHIHPTNKFILIWEFFVIIVTIFNFIIIPIDVAFGNLKEDFDNILMVRTIYVFFLDIIVKFNTAFYSRGQLIASKAKIFQNYFYGRFFSDLFSLAFLISTQISGYSIESWVIKAFAFTYLLRVRNLSRAISQFEDFLFCDEDSSNIVSFFRLLVNILLFSHWSACIWKIVGSSDAENGWLAYYHVTNQSLLNQYIFSLYYVVVVTNTVGFGDIVSQNIVERIFTIFFIYTACVIFAYTINRIGIIVQNINKKEFEFKKTMNTINGYMKIKNIGFELKIKIRNYLEYIWHAEKIQKNETQEIINRLSTHLKEELLLNANGFTLKKIPLFGNNFSEECLRKLVCEMKELNFTPEDIIYHENETNDQNIYIIHDGEVELTIPTSNHKKNITLKVLKKGDCFGQITFFTGLPRKSTAKSVSFSSLFVLSKESFISIISQNPADYEKFCVIKDEISLYNDYQEIFYRCEACLKQCHPVQECPYLHLTLSREKVLDRYNYTFPQKNRLKWKRLRNDKHPNSLKLMRHYNICAKAFTDSLRESIENLESNHMIEEEITKNSFPNLENEQEESSKAKEKNTNSGIISNHSLVVDVDHKDKETLKLSHDEGSPGLKKINSNESLQGQKWWYSIDNSTMDIDCVKNFDFWG